jgi:hypothetical protein
VGDDGGGLALGGVRDLAVDLGGCRERLELGDEFED